MNIDKLQGKVTVVNHATGKACQHAASGATQRLRVDAGRFAQSGEQGERVNRPLLRRLFDPNLHGASQDAVESVLRPQEPAGILGAGRADFSAHDMEGALDLDSHAGFKSVHTLFSLAALRSAHLLVGLGVKRVSKTPYSG